MCGCGCGCVEGGGLICPGDEWGIRAQETSMYTLPAWFGLYLRYCTLQKNVFIYQPATQMYIRSTKHVFVVTYLNHSIDQINVVYIPISSLDNNIVHMKGMYGIIIKKHIFGYRPALYLLLLGNNES